LVWGVVESNSFFLLYCTGHSVLEVVVVVVVIVVVVVVVEEEEEEEEEEVVVAISLWLYLKIIMAITAMITYDISNTTSIIL